MDEHSRDYRAGVLAGRGQVIGEITALVNRLSETVEPEHGPEMTLGTLVQNWLDVVAWLDQAGQEAEDEFKLLG